MCFGGVPSHSGQALRTRSWLPPMPPLATTTAAASIANSPISSRLLASPRCGLIRSQDAAGDADDGAVAPDELVDPVPEAQLDEPRVDAREHGR